MVKDKFCYVGNCVDSFDDSGDCTNNFLPFCTVSDFALAEEDIVEISKEQFYELACTEDSILDCTYHGYVDHEDLIVKYDVANDVHHFFVQY